MSNSENLKAFDERREALKPNGLSCEMWSPREVTPLEMRARLHRMALNNKVVFASDNFRVSTIEINKVETIAMFVAQNYTKLQIKTWCLLNFSMLLKRYKQVECNHQSSPLKW